jgi:hypothetical protein
MVAKICLLAPLTQIQYSYLLIIIYVNLSGLIARRPVVGPILKQHHRIARRAGDRARRRWRLHTWQHILFSEESRFALHLSDGRYRVYYKRGERFTDQCVY